MIPQMKVRHCIDLVSLRVNHGVITAALVACLQCSATATAGPGVSGCYEDIASGISICVEKDGRKLTGRDTRGHIVWRRDPFMDDREFQPYEFTVPRIVSIVALSGERFQQFARRGYFAQVVFSTREVGVVNVYTGEFIYLGPG